MLMNEEIENIGFQRQNTKINVITGSGTILANGIMTTTICGDYVEEHGNTLNVMDRWKRDHKWLIE
jgi:hypothetical protein